MRVIAGIYKGRKLLEFDGKDIRPTSDRAREALFNSIQNDIIGSSFYDGFSGSGAIGLEALSRGAKLVVLTDNSKESYNLIIKNFSFVQSGAEILLADSLSYLERTSHKFDYMFFDPPYALKIMDKIMSIIIERQLLTDNGVVIYEHCKGENFIFDGYCQFLKKIYGIAEFDWFKVKK